MVRRKFRTGEFGSGMGKPGKKVLGKVGSLGEWEGGGREGRVVRRLPSVRGSD